jgi:lysophospholipase L1-like esterase
MKAGLRTKLILLGASLLTVPVLVVTAEIGVRLFSTHLDPLSVFVSSPQLRSDTQGENTRGMFEFDPLLSWRLRANLRSLWWDFTTVSTNAQHLRMDRDLSPKTGLRIILLGDSVTFGYRVPVAANREKPREFDAEEKPFPALVEEELRAKFPERAIEVLPLACPGYSSWQGLAWLGRDIAALRPDFVIACFGWNDVRAAGLADRETMPASSGQATVRSLIGSSQLLLSLAASAQHRQAEAALPGPPVPRSSVQEYVTHFIGMQATCREHGAWFGILLPVYRDPNTPGIDPGHPDESDPEEGRRMTAYRVALQEAAEANGIPCLEIPELTERSWPGNGALFGERIHPNAAGHKLIATRLVEFLSKPVAESK